MRFQKIKSKSTFSKIDRHHNERNRIPHRRNAEREKENGVVGNKFYSKEETTCQRFNRLTEGIKIRKNAVLAVEFVLAYSPDYSYSDEWLKANLKWLSDTFGKGNTITVQKHFDETTPHLHAVVVPVVDGKLKAKHYFDGAKALSKLQDSYAAAMAPLGLERGKNYAVEGIPAPDHTSLKEYWRDEEMKAHEEKVFGKEEER